MIGIGADNDNDNVMIRDQSGINSNSQKSLFQSNE